MASMTKFLPLLWKFLPWPLALNADILLVQWGGCVLVYPRAAILWGAKPGILRTQFLQFLPKLHTIHPP